MQINVLDETGANDFTLLKRGSANAGSMGLGNGAGELALYNNLNMGIIAFGTGYIAIGTGNTPTERWRFENAGNLTMQGNYDFTPATDNQGDVGTASLRWASGHFGEVFAEVFVSPQTAANVSVAATDSRTTYTNESTTAQVNFNLPGAVAGLEYTFIVQDADGIQITAATGDTIRNGATVSAAGGTAASTTIGNVIKLTAINATEWITTSVIGTWTIT
jgi:hypothetical protein